MRFDISIFL